MPTGSSAAVMPSAVRGGSRTAEKDYEKDNEEETA